MAIFSIDTDEIVIAANKAGEFVFEGKSEEDLVKLLDIQERLENVIKQVKTNLEKQGIKSNPNFTGVRGDKIKVQYSAYGALYKISNIKEVEPDYYTKKVSYSPKSAMIEAFLENHDGKLPAGIIANDRKKSITISKLK